jgi:hypothetical protein
VFFFALSFFGAALKITDTLAHLLRKQHGGVDNIIEAKEVNIILVQAEEKTWLPFFVRHGFSLHLVIGRHVAATGDLTATRKAALGGLRDAVERMACD